MGSLDKKYGKGLLKEYNRWLHDSLFDYNLTYEPEDPIDAIELNLPMNVIPSKQVSKLKIQIKKSVKYRSDFDGLTFLKKICHKKMITRWIQFLSVKDVTSLIQTSKQINMLIDCNPVWNSLFIRDYYHQSGYASFLKTIKKSMKELYKYQTIIHNYGLAYHTGGFLDRSSKLDANLATNLIDFTQITSLKIKHLISAEQVLNNRILDSLKLSWDRDKNQIILWISGFRLHKSTWHYLENKPIAHEIQTYKFARNSIIKDAYFLNNDYLLIEIEGLEHFKVEENTLNISDNQNYQQKLFYIYHLETEIQAAITGTCLSTPKIYSFCNQARPVLSPSCLLNSFDTKEVAVCIEERFLEKGKIEAKILLNNQIMFFTNHGTLSFLIIFDISQSLKIVERIIELESPLVNIIQPKVLVQGTDQSHFLAIDEHTNLYKVSYALNTPFDVIKINPEPGNSEEAKDITQDRRQGPAFDRFPNSRRRYYHNSCLFQNSKQVEYLILLKSGHSFEFIDLHTLSVHKFCLTEEFKSDYISDWTVYRDKLYIIASQDMSIWKFEFPQFQIKKIGHQIQTQWREKNYFKQWIYVDSCFTIVISSYGNTSQELETLEVLVNSTPKILARQGEATTSCNYFEIKNILMKPPDSRDLSSLLSEKIQIKFEQGKLLIVTLSCSFFLDLEVCVRKSEKTNAGYVRNTWRSSEVVTLNKITQNKPVISTHIIPTKSSPQVTLKSIPLNKNLKKAKVDWKGCQKKVDIQYRKEAHFIRRNGYKYLKTFRNSQRFMKYKTLKDIDDSKEELEASEDFSDTVVEENFYTNE